MSEYFDEEHATFGDRLAAARESAGLNRAQLARRIGVKQSSIGNWEEDRGEPRANRLAMLAGLLGVSMRWLINGEGEGLRSPSIEDPRRDLAEAMAELRAARREAERALARMRRVEGRVEAILLAR